MYPGVNPNSDNSGGAFECIFKILLSVLKKAAPKSINLNLSLSRTIFDGLISL